MSRGLKDFRERFDGVPMMALTATATPSMQGKIIRSLAMEGAVTINGRFDRPNLDYNVCVKSRLVVSEMASRIIALHFCETKGLHSGIVYCLSKRDCSDVANELQQKLEDLLRQRQVVPNRTRQQARKFGNAALAKPYHAGLTQKQRKDEQAAWTAGQVPILCCTTAFGMGIDKPDVRWVFHHSMPQSLVGYHQETGRAGRDGLRAEVVMFYEDRDVNRWRATINSNWNQAGPDVREVQLADVDNVVAFATNTTHCRRILLMRHFGVPVIPGPCFMCNTCRPSHTRVAPQLQDLPPPAAADEPAAEAAHGVVEIQELPPPAAADEPAAEWEDDVVEIQELPPPAAADEPAAEAAHGVVEIQELPPPAAADEPAAEAAHGVVEIQELPPPPAAGEPAAEAAHGVVQLQELPPPAAADEPAAEAAHGVVEIQEPPPPPVAGEPAAEAAHGVVQIQELPPPAAAGEPAAEEEDAIAVRAAEQDEAATEARQLAVAVKAAEERSLAAEEHVRRLTAELDAKKRELEAAAAASRQLAERDARAVAVASALRGVFQLVANFAPAPRRGGLPRAAPAVAQAATLAAAHVVAPEAAAQASKRGRVDSPAGPAKRHNHMFG